MFIFDNHNNHMPNIQSIKVTKSKAKTL